MSPRQKRRSVLAEQWISYSRELIESPALRVLSQTASRVMHRLEAEHMNHGGAENGRLQVTFDQFEKWGVDRNAIAPAIRELVALGFVVITEKGIAGAESGKANRFRLTYVNSKTREIPTNEWDKVTTLEEAEKLAADARANKNERARDLGKRGAMSMRKKYFPVSKPLTGSVSKPLTEPPGSQSANPRLLGSVSKPLTTIYNLGGEAELSHLPWGHASGQPSGRFLSWDPLRGTPVNALAFAATRVLH
jgi:hypothetical protein